MAKTHRGKGLVDQPAHARGTCPICKSTRVKLLYTNALLGDAEAKVCKRCRSKK